MFERRRFTVGRPKWVALLALTACLACGTATIAQQQLEAEPKLDTELTPPADTPSNSVTAKKITITEAAPSSREAIFEQLAQDADYFQAKYGLVKRIVNAVEPSIVHIEAKKSTTGKSGKSTSVEEAGSGIIVRHRDRFVVVTNRHVVVDANSRDIRVQLKDGRFFRPTSVRSDRDSDVAILFVNESDLIPARLGDSDEVAIGDFAVAIGSPFGLNHSVSYGIISAKGRRDLELGAHGVKFQDFLQTDAAINPGNSGGPLINLRGEVIGINTAIASNSGGSDGIGFTIPINMAMTVVRELADYGRVRRGFLGVSLDSRYGPSKAEALGLNNAYGARISAITPNSPAAETDLRVGDIIQKLNGRIVENDSHLVNRISLTPVNSTITLDVYRDGRSLKISATIADRQSVITAKPTSKN